MRFSRVALFSAFAWMVFSLAASQGSAGQYGQSVPAPGGGGFSGGGRPSAERNDALGKKSNFESDDARNIATIKSAVLSPGANYEIKLKMQPNEVLIAWVTSDAFDPAINIEDDRGVVLAKNDDRSENDQSPLVICHVPREATYSIKVQSLKSLSGGKFTLSYRTFLPIDVAIGKQLYGVSEANVSKHRRIVLRFKAEKGNVYDLNHVRQWTVREAGQLQLLNVYGPTAVNTADYEPIDNPSGAPVFRAKVDGDFFAEYYGDNVDRISVDYRVVPVQQISASASSTLEIPSGALAIFEFPVKENEIVHTKIAGKSLRYIVSVDQNDAFESDDAAYGNNASFMWIRLNRDSNLDVVRAFHISGKAIVALRNSYRDMQSITISNSDKIADWESSKPSTQNIAIGESRVFLIQSTKSELMKVRITADHFQPQLDIFRMNGELANTLIDREKHIAADDLYFPNQDKFIVRVSCDGDGGSGALTMYRETLKAIIYTLGTPITMQLDGTNFGFYSVDLEAGKRYQLTTDDPANPLRADLLDEDGQFLTSSGVRFDKTEVQYFVPTRSGRHRLWLRGQVGTRKFRFEVHQPPTLGGG